MNCECCGQPKPVPCVECGAVTYHVKSKRSATGNRYQVRECDQGHTTVVTHDGNIAKRYSRELEHDGMPQGTDKGSYWKGPIQGGRMAIRA